MSAIKTTCIFVGGIVLWWLGMAAGGMILGAALWLLKSLAAAF